MSKTLPLPIKLTPVERKKLRKRTTGYRKVAIAAHEAKVSRYTIYNAIAGKNILADNADKIRTFLNPVLETNTYKD